MLAAEFKAEKGKQVLATITLLQTGWLAITLVFGPKGLVLRSSQALIPTVMISISAMINPQIRIII